MLMLKIMMMKKKNVIKLNKNNIQNKKNRGCCNKDNDKKK